MPIYEYEPDDRECLMCNGRVQVIQSIHDEALKICPDCGLEVKRVVSRVAFKIDKGGMSADKAAAHGLSTFKRAESGVWEKVAGPGVDAIVSTDEDRKAIQEEKAAPAKVLDLDAAD
jgi:putative FmdB family regulatory protein